MALSIGISQLSLHQCSKAVAEDQRSSYAYSKRSQWQPPVFPAATCTKEEPVIPSPTVFEGLVREPIQNEDDLSTSRHHEALLPSVAECAVHLQLLDCFLMLRERVLKSNALDCAFSIRPVVRYQTHGYGRLRKQVKVPDTTLKKRREVKWTIFVQLAVSRFSMWWWETEERGARYRNGEFGSVADEWLPPLDVLMVWHSLMLNPKLYKSFCEAGSFKTLQELDMPWAAIHQAISSRDGTYTLRDFTTPISAETSVPNNGLLQLLSNYATFPPALISILSKWANSTSDIEPADLSPLLTDIEPPLSAEQISLVQAISLAIPTNAETEPETYKNSDPKVPPFLSAINSAVHRQSLFTTKMHHQAWLRSPSLAGTLQRGLQRYKKYLSLFRPTSSFSSSSRSPSQMLVPTLDIDLIWHTHLCSPRQYSVAVLSLAGRFIGHDDTIAEGALRGGEEATRDLWRVRYGEQLVRCLCWECEGVRSALEEEEGNGEGKVRGDGDGDGDGDGKWKGRQDGEVEGAEVETEVDFEAVAERVSVGVAYHRAVEIARRKGKKLLPARLKK